MFNRINLMAFGYPFRSALNNSYFGRKINRMEFWFPFRSREVVEIMSHLTAGEILAFRALRKEFGEWFVPRIAFAVVGMNIVVDYFVDSFQARLVAMCVVGATMGLILRFLPRVSKQKKEIKKFLCSTNYASQVGYEPDSLRLEQFWFSTQRRK